MKLSIYCIRNLINNKVYIGSATNFKLRFRLHKSDLNKNKHCNKYLQRAWNKYGSENFIFEVIDTVEDKKDLLPIEQAYLEAFKPEYNICRVAGSMFGYRFSEKSKGKMSRNHPDVSGKNNPMYGKKHSEETRLKMGIRFYPKGKNHPNYGKKWSKDIIKNMSEVKVGEKNPSARLNELQVRIIKWLCKNTDMTQKEIGNIFDISNGHVCKINTGKKWRHII